MVGREGGPLVITDGQELTPVTGNWLSSNKGAIEECYLFGGQVSVTSAVEGQIEAKLR
jgi:hypothetical protein